MTINLTDPQAPVSDEELDQMIWKLERDGGMTPKMLSLMRELREVRRAKAVTLSVWYGAMPESNGRENWTAMLHRKGAHPWEGIMIDRSEYPGRALYEADRMRFLIGEIDDEPDILAYDSETHSGYVEKLNQPVRETNGSGWIPVSERMPDVGVKVLCFPVEDEPIHASFNGQLWLQDISWSVSDENIDNVISCNVTHWQPLPTTPKEVG